jgi:hypothetical protein
MGAAPLFCDCSRNRANRSPVFLAPFADEKRVGSLARPDRGARFPDARNQVVWCHQPGKRVRFSMKNR